METFIVLGFCFILYEALDFFQSCYSNNNRHHQQHPQFNNDISGTNTKENVDNNDENATTATNLRDVITSMPLSDDTLHVKRNTSELDLASSSHSYGELDDSVEFDANIQAYDGEETIINNQSNPGNIFSICDRVNNFNRQPLIDYQSNENKNSNFNDYDKLIAS